MSLQTEWDVRNSPSNQPGIVWSKRSLATQCANPQCSKELLYLREGRLALLDLESHANDQSRPDDGAFAMRPLPSSIFWLCSECSKTYVVKRWTTAGLVVALRNHTGDSNRTWLIVPPTGTAQPLPRVPTVPIPAMERSRPA
jgi:hypothetical protein